MLDDQLCMANFNCPLPWEEPSDEEQACAEELGGADQVGYRDCVLRRRQQGDGSGVSGSSVAGYWAHEIAERNKSFGRNLFWATTFLFVILALHVPAVAMARAKVHREKRQRRVGGDKKKKKRSAGRSDVSVGSHLLKALFQAAGMAQHPPIHDGRNHKGGAGPHAAHGAHDGVSALEQFSNSAPRYELYLLMHGVQSVASSATFILVNTGDEANGVPAPSTWLKFGAAIALCVWPIGFVVHVARFVRNRVQLEQRAVLLKCKVRTGGYLRWVDMPGYVAERTAAMQRAQLGTRTPADYTGPSRFCETLLSIERAAPHSDGLDPHFCAVL